MRKARQVAGGGRAVEVAPERLRGWFQRFETRNGAAVRTLLSPSEVVVTAENATTATARVPFPPLTADASEDGLAVEPLIAHARRSRRIGLLLARLGAHSVGIAEDGQILASRTGRHLVHGRNAAGGQSQRRFARRREGQARRALRRAGDDACDVLASRVDELDAVVLGGDRRALDELRDDHRLTRLFALAMLRILDVPEPRRPVLDDAATRARAVEIVVDGR